MSVSVAEPVVAPVEENLVVRKVPRLDLRPYLKWAGGKANNPMGLRVKEFYEANKADRPKLVLPFSGALGTFFRVRPSQCICNDSNLALVSLHRYIQQGGTLLEYPKSNTTDNYYVIRERFNAFKLFYEDLVTDNITRPITSLLSIIDVKWENEDAIAALRDLVLASIPDILKAFAEEANYEDGDTLSPVTLKLIKVIDYLEQQLFTDFIWLNKACVNGLYRVNKSGCFSTPKGSSTHPSVLQNEAVPAYVEAFKAIDLRCGNFDDFLGYPSLYKEKCTVYFDPPYVRTHEAYTKDGFGSKGLERLLTVMDICNDRGWAVCMSNIWDEDLIAEVTRRGYTVESVNVRVPISNDPKGRGVVKRMFCHNS